MIGPLYTPWAVNFFCNCRTSSPVDPYLSNVVKIYRFPDGALTSVFVLAIAGMAAVTVTGMETHDAPPEAQTVIDADPTPTPINVSMLPLLMVAVQMPFVDDER